MNNHLKFKKILIAPLDWGLGHATRCIPLIYEFLSFNCEVTIAAAGPSLTLLKVEFPKLKFLNLNTYNIIYSKNKRWMAFKVALQIPKILKAIQIEHTWLKKLLKQQHFDAIFSDNRYGFYSKNVYSVFISHQLQIKTAFYFTDTIIRWLTYKRIYKFHECWVPDFESKQNLAGLLSHPATLPNIPLKYIGTMSRFKKVQQEKFWFKYLIIVSGPEPQRSLFEKKIFEFISETKEQCLIVLGKPSDQNNLIQLPYCKIFNHLSSLELEKAFQESEFIISHCGYTTVMDVIALKKKSILIPTPGQTEQEYLARHLVKQNWCYTFFQDEDFDIHLKKAETFKYILPDMNAYQYKKYIQEFIETL